jgi:hypothetical protein
MRRNQTNPIMELEEDQEKKAEEKQQTTNRVF